MGQIAKKYLYEDDKMAYDNMPALVNVRDLFSNLLNLFFKPVFLSFGHLKKFGLLLTGS